MHRGYTKSWRKKYYGRTASRGLLYVGAMDWLVGNANWKEGWHDGQKVGRGQVLVGRKKLAEAWKVSEQSVRTILSNLKRDEFLTIESTSQGCIVTISNFDIYQSDEERDQPADQPPTNQRSTNDQPLSKNEKNLNIVPPLVVPPTGETDLFENQSPDPEEKTKSFKQLTEKEFRAEIAALPSYASIAERFADYWTEKSASGKMRFQLEKTWETDKRLRMWLQRENGRAGTTVAGKVAEPWRGRVETHVEQDINGAGFV